jgi:hypothetical protein
MGVSAYRLPAWAAHYPENRFAGLLCQIDTPVQMKQCRHEMRTNQIGYRYSLTPSNLIRGTGA